MRGGEYTHKSQHSHKAQLPVRDKRTNSIYNRGTHGNSSIELRHNNKHHKSHHRQSPDSIRSGIHGGSKIWPHRAGYPNYINKTGREGNNEHSKSGAKRITTQVTTRGQRRSWQQTTRTASTSQKSQHTKSTARMNKGNAQKHTKHS